MIIERYKKYMYNKLQTNPETVRKRLIQVWKGFGRYQKLFPSKSLPRSKQYLSNVCMQFLLDGFTAPEKAVLTSLFMPCEILHAFDIAPICAEMISTFINGAFIEDGFVETAENAGIAETFCSYHKIVMGAARTGVLPECGFIVNTSLACDANNLTFRYIAGQTGTPQYFIDVPYSKTEQSVQYVMKQLKEVVSLLEDATGKKLEREKLQKVVDRSAQTVKNMNATIPYRKSRFLPGTLTTELYEALMLHNALGTPEALKYSEMLLKDYENAENSVGVKVLWMHTNPYWQDTVKNLFNNNRAQHIVATELGYDNWLEADPSDPFRFMAERLVFNSFNGPAEDRIEYSRRMAEQTEADGIVVFCHWGCKTTSGASAKIKKDMEAAGYPVLLLNGDGVDRANVSSGQTLTRLEAFLEMLREMKK